MTIAVFSCKAQFHINEEACRPGYDHHKYEKMIMPDLRLDIGQTILEPRRKRLHLQEHFRVLMHNGVSLLVVTRVKNLRVPRKPFDHLDANGWG